MNIVNELMKYFETTPRQKVVKDWEETKEFDSVGTTADEFLIKTKEEMENKKQKIVDALIEDFKNDFNSGDYTVIDELLMRVPTELLYCALSDENMAKLEETNRELKEYFEVSESGYNEQLERDEMTIRVGDNGMIVLTNKGGVVNITTYSEGEIIDEMEMPNKFFEDKL